MGWPWATVCASDEFSSSCHITKPFSDYLLNWNFSYMNVKLNSLPGNLPYIILNIHEQHSNFSSKLHWRLSQLAFDLATEKGASDWLTALPFRCTGLPCTSLHFWMQFLYVMAGLHSKHQFCVLVAPPFLLNMHSPALKGDFHLSDIMRLGTS